MRRVAAPASPGTQVAPKPPAQSGARGGSRHAASLSLAGHVPGAGNCLGAGSGRSGAARPRQARQNGVNTLYGSPPSVFTSHGSNRRLPFRLSAATPRAERDCFNRASRSREPCS